MRKHEGKRAEMAAQRSATVGEISPVGRDDVGGRNDILVVSNGQ